MAAAALVAAAAVRVAMASRPPPAPRRPGSRPSRSAPASSTPGPTSLLEGGASAAADVAAARRAVSGQLERQLGRLPRARSPSSAPRSPPQSAPPPPGTRSRLAAAGGARSRRSATARSTSRSTRRAPAEVERARGWLLIRDFRQATRFTRPGVDATTALDGLEAGEIVARRGGHRGPQGPARRLPGAPRHLHGRGEPRPTSAASTPRSPRTPRSRPATGGSSPPSTRRSAAAPTRARPTRDFARDGGGGANAATRGVYRAARDAALERCQTASPPPRSRPRSRRAAPSS